MALESVIVNVTQETTPVEVVVQNARDAYQLAVADGFVGTRVEWEASLEGDQGPQGLSAYQVAVAAGFVGTVEQWLISLIGAQGLSAYEVAAAAGFGGTVGEWLESLVGEQGLSAYQVAVAAGFVGTVEQWLASLVGEPGEVGNIPTLDVTTDATTGRTLTTADIQKFIHFTHASGCAITITTDASGGWNTFAEIAGLRGASAGAITLSFAGVTVIGSANVALVSQGQPFALKRIGSDTWAFF